MRIEHAAGLDDVAGRQHGLVTTQQAIELLGPSRKSRWVMEGRLVSTQPGVLRVAGAPATWHQRLHAAALAADGIVSHRSAAELWGILPATGHVEVSIHPDRRPRLRPPAVAHRIKDLRRDLAVERQGMQITDPVRTIIDLGLVVPPRTVGAALSSAISRRLVRIGQAKSLREALGRQGRNGTGIAGELIAHHLLTGGGETSELEKRLGDLVRGYTLPTPRLQHEVWHEGRCVGTIDAAYPEILLAIEVDGFEFHSSPEAFQRDRTRQNELVALGWTVLRFTWTDVVNNPARVARMIRDAIRRLQAA